MIRDLPRFFDLVRRGEPHSYGKGLCFVHRMSAFDEESQALIVLLQQSCMRRRRSVPRPDRSLWKEKPSIAWPHASGSCLQGIATVDGRRNRCGCICR